MFYGIYTQSNIMTFRNAFCMLPLFFSFPDLFVIGEGVIFIILSIALPSELLTRLIISFFDPLLIFEGRTLILLSHSPFP